ncbi:MAG: NfeD family protein [Stenomitos rutilans HA7619-LM2]|jgi:membrane protein implicated in regulation of membrane protease activity|nr:NfeD family protein [Stenomitos rutilans HA7619-LM2]
MMTFNPIKALNTLLFDAPTACTATNFLQGADTSYKGRAVVSETITPCLRGRVYFQGSWWLAQCEQDITIAVDEVVQVIGRQNITLLVRAI